ncbi:hypothetical protein BDN70DRAFT_492931 [Pholiota conissans]|uniref:Uncharacterized protein n=1 Tax=Pholiota conissans TaxID=109636 RepID=A0A9P5Z8J4_9AGAR|nr:hypothetical protein BDN70DRAFT_492931 [Pholiota conissans]
MWFVVAADLCPSSCPFHSFIHLFCPSSRPSIRPLFIRSSELRDSFHQSARRWMTHSLHFIGSPSAVSASALFAASPSLSVRLSIAKVVLCSAEHVFRAVCLYFLPLIWDEWRVAGGWTWVRLVAGWVDGWVKGDWRALEESRASVGIG